MKNLGAELQEMVRGGRAWVNGRLDAKWDNDPFGTSPRASAAEYMAIHRRALSDDSDEIRQIESKSGFAIDRKWLDDLALHTQVVKKNSPISYLHGRLLYSLVRQQLALSNLQFMTVLETGTARGYSAVCIAKAISDHDADGRIITIDVLPHLKKQYWNCIDDHEGRKSRQELLAPWSNLLNRIVFLQGDTLSLVPKVGLDRINFAFLDAQHVYKSVRAEFDSVAARQLPGDVVFFVDVTPDVFPGVVRVVDEVEEVGQYTVSRLKVSDNRAYAWATRV